jgi:hypothetical protein
MHVDRSSAAHLLAITVLPSGGTRYLLELPSLRACSWDSHNHAGHTECDSIPLFFMSQTLLPASQQEAGTMML